MAIPVKFFRLNFDNIKFGVIVISSLILYTLPISAQPGENVNPSLSQIQFIKGCAAYRENVIQGITETLIGFNQLVESIKAEEDNPGLHDLFREHFMNSILSGHITNVEGMIVSSMLASFQNLSSPYLDIYKEWGKINQFTLFEINNLVHNEIIEPNPPYILYNLKNFWKEISFYDIKADQTVVDLGTGNGFLSFILAMSGLPLNLITTEIDEGFYEYLEPKILIHNQRKEFSDLSLIRGQEKETGLDSIMADRIIMREVFHHVKYPKEILLSVKEHLRSDGLLVLLESATDFYYPKNQCIQSISCKEIVRTIRDEGFELVDKKIAGGAYLLKFKLSN